MIRDPGFDTLIEHIVSHPGMLVIPPTLAGVIAFIDGFSRGRHGAPLLGLREWLVVRARGGNNLRWSAMACQEIAGNGNDVLCRGDDPELIAALTRLIQEYLTYREANGLSKLFWEYAKWLRRQKWYTGPLSTTATEEKTDDAPTSPE